MLWAAGHTTLNINRYTEFNHIKESCIKTLHTISVISGIIDALPQPGTVSSYFFLFFKNL